MTESVEAGNDKSIHLEWKERIPMGDGPDKW